jgi:3,4-dihydroxy 2-butanone 4-phosphate synthase
MSKSGDTSGVAGGVESAIEAFRRGTPVCIHDAADREGETDIVYPAGAVTPEAVAHVRNDAGGLVCVALSDAVAEAFALPFLREKLDHPAAHDETLSYGDRSAFSLTVNHRETDTGITDEDRSLTIRALADAAADPEGTDFPAVFQSPGHVHLLRAAPGLLADRQGHTEMALALARAADRPPAAVVCEMLDDETGGALLPAAARAYAERNDIPYVEGASIVERFG